MKALKLNEKLSQLDSYPFHMPGHKRNPQFNILGSDIDITEIEGFDNLHSPCDIIADMEKSLSEIYGYKRSIISVNGSTCCILAAISAVSKKGSKIIIARNCHKSVYNACIINDLNISFIEPQFCDEYGIYTYVTQEAVDKAIEENPDACAVVITSPTYEGFVSRINCSLPLIIDSAHGAHFSIDDYFPEKLNGDIIIQSLHKTLPALTQTAVIHINNTDLSNRVKRYMDIYESSSPSYILLASIDRCIDFLNNSKSTLVNYRNILDKFYSDINGLKRISYMKNDDPTRIVLTSSAMSGISLAEKLREYDIEPEGATINYVILISSVCDTAEGFELLTSALREIDEIDGCFEPYISKCAIPEKSYNHNKSKIVSMPLDDCIGRISAEYVYAYPPAIPILAPDEIIRQDTINMIKTFCNNGVNVISDSNLLPKTLLVY